MNEGYSKVFVALDGTEQQDFVLARAIKVAANNKAKLIIGHVIDSTALESAGSYPIDLVNGLEEAFKNSIEKQVEEAKGRDHNKIGRDLEYFTTVDYIGQGLPVMLPKGARVIQLMQRWVEDVEYKHGCMLTKTPLMAKRELFKISGHWDHYLDGMFIMGDPQDEEKE